MVEINLVLRNVCCLSDPDRLDRLGVLSLKMGEALSNRLLNVDRQLLLQDEFAFLILLRCYVGSVVLPAECSLALGAADVPHRMQTCGHVSVFRLAQADVGDRVKKIGAAMLTVEGAADEVLDGSKVGLALFAAKDALTAEILLVCHAHLDSGLRWPPSKALFVRTGCAIVVVSQVLAMAACELARLLRLMAASELVTRRVCLTQQVSC